MGTQFMVKPGETVQYFIEMSGADEGVARLKLEYTQDGGQRWHTEKDASGDDIDETGTVGDPMLGLVCQGFVLNETPKPKVYRWRAVTFDRANSAVIPTWISKHETVKKFKFDDYLYLIWNNDAPVSGIDGDGANYCGPGSIYIDTDLGRVYRNDGTSTMPSWVGM